MDKEMIERCAQALSTAIENFRDTHKPGEVFESPDMVLSVIKAMREPTEKMLEAGAFIDTAQSGVYSCGDVYQAMIDAITGAE